MLQFDLQFYEELTVARVKTVKFIREHFFGRQVSLFAQRYSNGTVFIEKHQRIFTQPTRQE